MSDFTARGGEPSDVESRVVTRTVEVRASSGGQLRIGGKAATFGTRSEPLPGPYGATFIETIADSFFNMSRGLGWPSVIATYNHDPNMLLGATRSGSLQLTVDAVGLDYTCDLPETRRDTYESVARSDIGASSFTFVIVSADGDRWDYTDGMPLRTLISGKLLEVSAIAGQPAYGSTSVGLRSLARFMDAPESDVTDAALAGELRRFFTRTDRQKTFPPKPVQGSDSRARRATARQRQLEVLAYRWGTPLTERQEAVERLRVRSSKEKQLETYGMDPDWQ